MQGGLHTRILLDLVKDIVFRVHFLPRKHHELEGQIGGRKPTCPALARLVPCIAADFLDVGGVDLHFFGRHGRKWHTCNVENPITLIRDVVSDWKEGYDDRYLSLGIAVVDCVDEAVGAKGIAKLWCELSATLGSVRFGQVDDREISKIH